MHVKKHTHATPPVLRVKSEAVHPKGNYAGNGVHDGEAKASSCFRIPLPQTVKKCKMMQQVDRKACAPACYSVVDRQLEARRRIKGSGGEREPSRRKRSGRALHDGPHGDRPSNSSSSGDDSTKQTECQHLSGAAGPGPQRMEYEQHNRSLVVHVHDTPNTTMHHRLTWWCP